MNTYISNIISSKDLFALADNLERFISSIQATRKKREIIDELRRRINILLFYMHVRMEGENYYMHNNKESVLLYLDNYWPLNRTYNEDIRCLESIVDRIHTSILPSKTMHLSIKTINDLMALAERKFSFCSKILQNKPIRILLFNYMHSEWNCYYSASVIPGNITKEYIMMTTPHGCCAQQYSFLHELGHVLHTRATRELLHPPESFQLICDYLLKKDTDLSRRELCEAFADFFAIAVFYQTEFERYIPYTNFTNQDKEIFKMYYASVIDSFD